MPAKQMDFADDIAEKAGSATKRTQSAASNGRTACTSTTKETLTTFWRHNETLVGPRCDSQVSSDECLDWTSKQITYGLYLSDHSILNDVETELTVLSGIMIQNLPRETAWHLRGTRRIGVSMEDVETLQQCVCANASCEM